MFLSNHFSKLLFMNFKLLFWLIFHPSAWRDYVNRIDSALLPDFALADLSTHYQLHPEIKRLKWIAFLIQPLWVLVVISLVLLSINFFHWFLFEGLPQVSSFVVQILSQFFPLKTLIENASSETKESMISFENMILGVSYGTMLCLVGSLISSVTISMAFGLVASALGGILLGVLIGLNGETGTLVAIWLGVFILSLASSMIASLPATPQKPQLTRQIYGVLISLAMSAIVLVAGGFLGAGVGMILKAMSVIDITSAQAQIIGMVAAAGLLLGWRLRDWRWMFILPLFFAAMMIFFMSVIFNLVNETDMLWLNKLLAGFTGGTVNAFLFTILFTLAYMLARYIAGIEAGIVTGILGSGGTYVGFVIFLAPHNLTDVLAGSLVGFILGLTYQKWLPVVLYPFFVVWNLSLYLLSQKRGSKQSVVLLHHHSAFWDEHQFLPLWGLEKQLVHVYQQDNHAASVAMAHLSAGAQSWAVESAQITLDSQSLARCQTITDIAAVYPKLLTSEQLTGATGDWLNSFREMSQKVEDALSQEQHQQQATLLSVIERFKGTLFSTKEESPELQRFRKTAAQWQGIVEKRADELLNIQELPNIYTFGPPINKKYHEVFAERPQVTHRLEQLLQNRHCPPLLLYGQRRTGKTSLLINLDYLLPSTFVMLFVDCQGPVSLARDPASLFYNLGRAINDAQEKYPKIKFPPLDEDGLRADPFTRFDQWLDKLEQATGDKTLLLALDEFVTIDEAFEDKRLQPAEILGMFRHIIQHRPRFRLLFAGTHTFANLQHWASYLINVQTVQIGYLSEEEARQLIERPVKYFPVRYTPEASQRLIAITRAHPALVQLVCGELIQLKNGQNVERRLKVEVDDVEVAVQRGLEHGAFFFADIEQNQVDDIGRAILHFMASHDEGVPVSQAALSEQFGNNLEQILASLKQRDIIEAQQEGYCFQVEMIRRWFAKE
jgi:hypothetical protein